MSLLQIDLQTFLDLYTYNGVCDGQAITQFPDIARQIEELDPEHKICYVDRHDFGISLWSIKAWTEEKERIQLLRSKIRKPISDSYQVALHKVIKEEEALPFISKQLLPKEPEDPNIMRPRSYYRKKNKGNAKRNDALAELLAMGIKL